MGKNVINFIWALCFVVMLESLLYIKDYNELIIFDNYVNYEINKYGILDFNVKKYDVVIEENDEFIRYTIVMKRNGILNLERCKNIKYDGIVYSTKL